MSKSKLLITSSTKGAFDWGPAPDLPPSCSFCWEERQFTHLLKMWDLGINGPSHLQNHKHYS